MQHKSKYQSRVSVVMAAFLLVLMFAVSAQAAPFTAPKKLADYLYYMEYTDYVPDFATGENIKQGFACSSVRNGNFYGRNLDLDYSDVPEFVIKVAAKEGRYASIGIAAILTLKSNEVDKVSEAELLAMPNLTFDGINENGVAMNCNVAPAIDLDFATLLSTNYGKPRIHAVSVVRYVLDHAKSAAHGVELLKDMDIYGGYGTWGLHWMLSDEKETYIIECIDGELVARNDTDNIMTNFYVNYAPNTPYAKHIAQTGQTVAGKVYENFPILTPHACGVERYAILKEHYAEGAESAEGMAHLMERVKYTQSYEADTNPFWYTEFTEGNLTIANAPMDFKAVIQYSIDTYKLHDRNIHPNNFWQTWHTAVYDLANRTLRLNIQEDYSKHYDFKLTATATQKAPDYSQKSSWYKLPAAITKDVDTFYINSTAYIMGSFEEGAPDYATLDNAEMLAGFAEEYMTHATVYEDCTNVFMPYYRQAGLRYAGEVYKNTGDGDSALLGMPYDDITSALDYYFKNYNNGRPFIIAGHSQGSAITRLVLKKYFKEHPEYYERMIAAYVIGYSVTKDDLKAYPHLKFAADESDTGVIVSWNTEGPKNVETNANNVVVLPGTMSINPLNWKLDETYAPASENLGSLVANEKTGEYEIGDIGADAKINLARGVVVTNAEVENISEEAAKLFAEFFGPDGRHNNDYTYYYNNIKANVAKRVAAYKAIVQEQASNKKITDGKYDKSLAVKCVNGTFVGQKTENIITYKGIPFVGKQPVGKYRWKAPVDFVPDDGVYEAYYNAKAACQSEEIGDYQGEDCLYLNLWKADEKSAEKKPVMVWIHGGAFTAGGTGIEIFDCTNFVKENPDVIVVTVAYRLGVLGFLNLSHLPDGKDYPDAQNLGLLDQKMALKWVHENIAGFGGDPDNVTIWGESAGGGSVTMLPLIEGSQQYFKRVISQSGSVSQTNSLEESIECTNEFMEKLGCKTVAELLNIDAKKLVDTAADVIALHIFPVRDGRILPLDPYEAYANGAAKDIAFLQGCNKDEMNCFVFDWGVENFKAWAADRKTKKYAKLLTDKERAMLESYCNEGATESWEPDSRLFGHSWFIDGAIKMSESQAKAGGKSYTYYYRVEASPELKAAHFEEVPIVFCHPEMSGRRQDYDEIFSRTMRKMWVQFAKTGNPSLSAEISPDGKAHEWPLYDLENKNVMVLDEFDIHPAKESEINIVDWERTYFLIKYYML